MLAWALKKVFGTSHEREIRRLRPRVEAIAALEGQISKLTDAELKAKTGELKGKLDNGATLDDILHEAFAVAREAGKRVLKMRQCRAAQRNTLPGARAHASLIGGLASGSRRKINSSHIQAVHICG